MIGGGECGMHHRRVPATFHLGSRNGNWATGSESDSYIRANGVMTK